MIKIEVRPINYSSGLYIRNNEGNIMYNIPYYLSSSNCKLQVLESIGQIFIPSNTASGFSKTDEELKEIFDGFIKQLPGRNILITLTNQKAAEWITKNYTCYYYHQVPCGYSDGLQHHVLLKNHSDSRAPIIPKGTVDKNEMLTLVTSAFEATNNRQKRLELISDGIDAINAK